MKYLVTEMQTSQDGTVAQLTTIIDDRLHAESTYHSILASAAISNLLCHAAILYTSDGQSLMSAFYTHEPEPQPEPEETNEEIPE